MSIDVVLSFSGIDRGSQPIVAKTLRLVPWLSAGLLESCDLGVRPDSASLLLRARLADAPGAAAAVARLSSLTERAHGIVLSTAARAPVLPTAPGAGFEAAEVVDRCVAPAALAAALDRAFLALGAESADASDHAPAACAGLRPSRREHESFQYDPRRRELSLPSELALPIGQRMTLAVHSAMTDVPVLGVARVVKVRRHAGSRRHAEGRFAVTLAPEDDTLHAAFVLAAAGEATIAMVSSDAPPSRHRILVIDGLPGRLAQIVDALRGEGFDVGLLGTGSGAIAPDELAAADLVLVTAADPARAEAVLRAIRAASPGELPVVVASAAPPAQDGRLLRAGADSVVAVAATHGELVQTVQAVLDGSLAPVPVPAT